MHKKTLALSVLASLSSAVFAADLPHFIDQKDLENPTFRCLVAADAQQKYTPEEQKLVDTLWNETLVYLKAYARALTNDPTGTCRNSDLAIYDTTDGFKSMCITDRREVQLMVKHIYQVVNNPEKAKACFSPRKENKGLTAPAGELLKRSLVAQWLNRQSIVDFYSNTIKNPEVQKYGISFAKNFDSMLLGDDIKTPKQFGQDVSANTLPNLWASAGWLPMYAAESDRNKRNFNNVRGGYAYAEVMGPWGLLQIKSINKEPVVAEIGMTVQAMDTLYPYHNHGVTEMYYTIRKPVSHNQFRTFAVREDSPYLKTVKRDSKIHEVEFDSGMPNEQTMWASSSFDSDPLVYFHENTIHAFEVHSDGEVKPERRALVTVWSRGNVNPAGSTRLCENGEKLGTPAVRGGIVRCQLEHYKW